MSRLRHSAGGFARSMQLSRTVIWIFLEGPGDRSFYSGVCRANPMVAAHAHRLVLVREVPRRRANGKRALIGLYRYLRRHGALLTALGGKPTVSVFFVDKDIDDLDRKKAKSEHVIYTKYYTVENHIVKEADLVRGLAASASLDEASVEGIVGNNNAAWMRAAATHWRRWVEFCMLVRRTKSLCGLPNFGVESRLHPDPYAALDSAQEATLVGAALARSALPAHRFDEAFRSVERKVQKYYDDDHVDEIFNGKWYLAFLVADAQRAAAGRDYNAAGLKGRIVSSLVATINFQFDPADYFHAALSRIAAKI